MAGLDKWLYNFARRRTVPMLTLTGVSETVGATAVTVLQKDSLGKVLLATGTSVPTGAGYAKGCVFIKTDAAAGTSGVYTNVGSSTVASFVINSPAPFVAGNATVVAKGSTDTTILAAEISGMNVTNTGAGATVSLTLPTAASMIGQSFRVMQLVAQITQLLPQTGEAICLNGDAVVSKYLNIAAVIGNYVDVYCDGTRYHVTGYSGVVTKEA